MATTDAIARLSLGQNRMRRGCVPHCLATVCALLLSTGRADSDCVDDNAAVNASLASLGVPLPDGTASCLAVTAEAAAMVFQSATGANLTCSTRLRETCATMGLGAQCDRVADAAIRDLCCQSCLAAEGAGWGSELDALRDVLLAFGIPSSEVQGPDPCEWSNAVFSVVCGALEGSRPTYALTASSLGSSLSRRLSARVGELHGLRRLAVESLTGEVPTELASLTALESLELHGLGITNVRAIKNLPSLRDLRLEFQDDPSPYTGYDDHSLVPDVPSLTELANLRIRIPRVWNVTADYLASHPNLETVSVEACQYGVVPLMSHLPYLSEFSWMRLPGCADAAPQVTAIAAGSLPCSAGGCPPSHSLKIHMDNLLLASGLPDAWREADTLESLTITRSNFSAIPRWGRASSGAELVLLGMLNQTTTSGNRECHLEEATEAPRWGRLRTLDFSGNNIPLIEDILAFSRHAPTLNTLICANCSLHAMGIAKTDELVDRFFLKRTHVIQTSQGPECHRGASAVPKKVELPDNPGLACEVVCAGGQILHCYECPKFSMPGPDFPHEAIQQCICPESFAKIFNEVACPSNNPIDPQNIRNAVVCVCENYFHLRAGKCQHCVEGMQCLWSSAGSSLKEPTVLPGFWAASTPDCEESLRIFRCRGDDMCQPPDIQADCGEQLSICLPGRYDIGCSRCMPGHVGGPRGECAVCDRSAAPLLLYSTGIALVLLIAGVLQAIMRQGQEKPSSCGSEDGKGETRGELETRLQQAAGEADLPSMGVAAVQMLKFFQNMGIISRFALELPQANIEAFRVYEVMSLLDLDVFRAFQCLTDGDFRLAAYSWWLLPWILSVLCVPAFLLNNLLSCVEGCCRRCLLRKRTSERTVLRANGMDLLAGITWIWSTFHTSIAERSLTFFNCGNNHPGGDQTHLEHWHILCNDGGYIELFPIAVCAAVINIGLSIASVVFLVHVLLTKTGVPPLVKQSYQGVYRQFHHQAFLWVAVVTTKDTALILISCVLQSASLQGFLCCLVLIVYLVALAHYKPYCNMVLSHLEILLCIMLILATQVSCSCFPAGVTMPEEEEALRSSLLLAVQVSCVALPSVLLLLIAAPQLGCRCWRRVVKAIELQAPLRHLGFHNGSEDWKQAWQFIRALRNAGDKEKTMLLERLDSYEMKIFATCITTLENAALGYLGDGFNRRVFDDDAPKLFMSALGCEEHEEDSKLNAAVALPVAEDRSTTNSAVLDSLLPVAGHDAMLPGPQGGGSSEKLWL